MKIWNLFEIITNKSCMAFSVHPSIHPPTCLLHFSSSNKIEIGNFAYPKSQSSVIFVFCLSCCMSTSIFFRCPRTWTNSYLMSLSFFPVYLRYCRHCTGPYLVWWILIMPNFGRSSIMSILSWLGNWCLGCIVGLPW